MHNKAINQSIQKISHLIATIFLNKTFFVLLHVTFFQNFGFANVPPNLDKNAIDAISSQLIQNSLEPQVTDIPSTFTFRASCIKKTYVDGYYKTQMNAPTLVRTSDKGIYTLYATCLNGLGVPIKTKIKLKLIVRHIGDIRTISIRSIVDATKRYRNCADISNRNGILECVPAKKPSQKQNLKN